MVGFDLQNVSCVFFAFPHVHAAPYDRETDVTYTIYNLCVRESLSSPPTAIALDLLDETMEGLCV